MATAASVRLGNVGATMEQSALLGTMVADLRAFGAYRLGSLGLVIIETLGQPCRAPSRRSHAGSV